MKDCVSVPYVPSVVALDQRKPFDASKEVFVVTEQGAFTHGASVTVFEEYSLGSHGIAPGAVGVQTVVVARLAPCG